MEEEVTPWWLPDKLLELATVRAEIEADQRRAQEAEAGRKR